MEDIVAFKAICNFVKDLSEEFSDKQHSLALYNRLLEKTTFNNDTVIKKHVSIFREFVRANRTQILENKIGECSSHKVSYSERVYINIVNLYNLSDKNTKVAIYKHLLALSAILDPSVDTKKALTEVVTTPVKVDGDTNESKFLNDLITKVESSVSTDNLDNPMQAVSSILSSGLFNDLVTSMSDGINSGDLNIGKLMGTMQTVMTGLNKDAGGQMPDMSMLFSTLSSIAPPK